MKAKATREALTYGFMGHHMTRAQYDAALAEVEVLERRSAAYEARATAQAYSPPPEHGVTEMPYDPATPRDLKAVYSSGSREVTEQLASMCSTKVWADALEQQVKVSQDMDFLQKAMERNPLTQGLTRQPGEPVRYASGPCAVKDTRPMCKATSGHAICWREAGHREDHDFKPGIATAAKQEANTTSATCPAPAHAPDCAVPHGAATSCCEANARCAGCTGRSFLHDMGCPKVVAAMKEGVPVKEARCPPPHAKGCCLLGPHEVPTMCMTEPR